jgi:HK97 family phage major capsid protein
VLQDQIIRGDGVSPNLKGIYEYATTFAEGGFAGVVDEANEFDVLVAAATQILNANYVPKTALISHTTKGIMSLIKGSNGQYVLPPFISAGGLQVYGMNVISANAIQGDEFLVFDPSKSLFNWVESPTIEIGMINDDFEKNIWRLRCELQGVHRIKEHEKLAFVLGDFSVAKAAMETP